MSVIESSSEKRVLSRFETQALDHQQNEMKSPAEAKRQCLEGLVGGVGAILVLFIVTIAVQLFGGRDQATSYGVGIITCPIGLIGLGLLAQFVMAGSKLLTQRSGDIVCPKCRTRHNLFIGDRIYWCTSCFTPLHFQAAGKHDMTLLVCPYCTIEHAMQSDYRDFTCPDCGFAFDIANGTTVQRQFPTVPCAKCAATIPSMVYYCKSCWHINTTQFAEGYTVYGLGENRLGKGPTGHYVYALAAYELLSKETCKPRLAKDSIFKSFELIRGIERILESIELAIRTISPSLIAQFLANLDKPYAIILWKMSEEMARYGNVFRDVLATPLFILCGNEPVGFVLLRQKVVEIVSSHLPMEETRVLRTWQVPLLKSDRVSETQFKFTGYEALKEEAKRLYPNVVNIPFSVADS